MSDEENQISQSGLKISSDNISDKFSETYKKIQIKQEEAAAAEEEEDAEDTEIQIRG